MNQSTFNIFSINVGMSNNLACLSSLVNGENLDIIFLQENRMTQLQIESQLSGFSAAVNIDIDNPYRPGTAMIWRSSIPVTNVHSLSLCRLQVASLGPYLLVNVYGQSGSDRKRERELFFNQDLFNVFHLGASRSLLVGGDFNCILSPHDVENGVGFSNKQSPALRKLVNSFKLCDAFRILNQDTKEFTFFRHGCAPFRLDRFYLSANLKNLVISVNHIPSLSDHCGVKLEITLNLDVCSAKKDYKSSYWKLNSAILNEEDFLPRFQCFWSTIENLSPEYADIAEWWDKCAKPSIKDFCIAFSVERKDRRKQTLQYLLSSLKIALTMKDWEEVCRLKELVSVMLNEDAMGLIIRSRFKQNVEEEKASLYHASKELKNHGNGMFKLKIGNVVTEDESKIENEVVSYFGALFNGHHDKSLNDTGTPFVPDNSDLPIFLQGLQCMSRESSIRIEDDISIDDLDFVIKNCGYNKAPGLDGLTYEFYKKTWLIIKKTFMMVLQCQLDRQHLIDSDTVGATRLLSKVDGVPRVDELRPITLLNCDYRILSKLLVLRIKSVLSEVVKSSQLCTVQNKNILFGVQNIISSVLYIKQKKNLGACLLSLDFFKAYDRVLVDYLLVVMEKMGFGSTFCGWIKMLHVGAQTKFLLGKLSRAIWISFSIRQGDPIAMLLYILYIEPLLVYIESHIAGLYIKNVRQAVEAYCDDLNVLTGNVNDLVVVNNAVEKYEKFSGAILSRDHKCKILGLGTWKNKTNWPLPYIVTVKEIKVFGVYIMDSYRNLLKRNWDFRFGKFEQTLISWSPRNLDCLSQRIDVLRIFALSRIYYLASILPISKTMCKKIEKAMGRFIWYNSGYTLRVSTHDLKHPLEKGGLGLVCILGMSQSLQLSQLFRLLKSGDLKATGHVAYWIGEFVETFIPGLSEGEHADIVPAYYADLAELLAFKTMDESITPSNWRSLTNKILYNQYVNCIPQTNQNIHRSFKLLTSPSLDSKSRELMYLLLHNKLTVRERLFRIQSVNDPYCVNCMDDAGAIICDREHYFCQCVIVEEVWQTLKEVLRTLGIDCSRYTDLELLSLQLPKSSRDTEIVWIMSNYVHTTWSLLNCSLSSIPW